MKTIFSAKRISLSVMVLIVITMKFWAQGDPFTKEISKEFSVNQNTRFELINKYGNVDVLNRTDNNLSIRVVIKVNTRERQRAEDLLGMINIAITQEGDLIRAVTEIDEDFGKVFRGFGDQNGGLEINYTVTMPKTMPLNLSNKYGNVFIDELSSTSTVDVKYGKLTANKILHTSKEPLTKVFLSYSNGSIQETSWIELDIKYSKINITNSKALAIMSKYSKLFIDNGTSIVSESKYDSYEIGKLNNFITTAAYGHFHAREITGKLQVETKYSDFFVDRIPASFEEIRIDNSYGSYKLGIDPAASYAIDAYAKYCTVTYPENNAKVNRLNENNEMKVTGRIGTSQNPKAKVSVTTRYGNVRLLP